MDNQWLVSINSSTIPVRGSGGIGMLAFVLVLAIAFPVARWLLLGGLAGGVTVATGLLIVRRRSGPA